MKKIMDREKVIKGIEECDLNGGLIGNCPYKGILALLKEQESIIDSLMSDMDETLDVVTNQKNIVRCGDCAKRKKDECMIYWNGVMDDEMWNDNWFCADGVKKDD